MKKRYYIRMGSLQAEVATNQPVAMIRVNPHRIISYDSH